MMDIDTHVRVSIISKTNKLVHLDLVCKTKGYGLWKRFANFEELKAFIDNDTEFAFEEAVQKVEDDYYILNCQTHKEASYICGKKWEENQIEMITTFLPIIRMFMTEGIG